MTIPTLNIGQVAAYNFKTSSKSKPSYDSWRFFNDQQRTFATNSGLPYILCKGDFPLDLFIYPTLLYISGMGGHCPTRIPDPSELVTIESASKSAHLVFRTGSTIESAVVFTDPNQQISASLSHDALNKRLILSAGNNIPKITMWHNGKIGLGTPFNFSTYALENVLTVLGVDPGNGCEGTAHVTFSNKSAMTLQLRTDTAGMCSIIFGSPIAYMKAGIYFDHAQQEFRIQTGLASTFRFGFDRLGSVIVSSMQYPLTGFMPLASSLFYLYGQDSHVAKGPHWKAHTNADVYPLFQQLNWSHNNITLSFDCFYDGSWKSSHVTGSYQLTKLGARFELRCAQAAPNVVIPSFIAAIGIESDGRVQFQCSGTPATSAMVKLDSTVGAFLMSRMTTVQKNALTPINGMILYDLTLGKVQVYESGAWASVV